MSIQNKLSDTAIKNLKPQDARFKICDGDKLWLIVFPTGIKSWRFIWKDNGKSHELTIGQYPAISLKLARKERDRLNSLVAQGIDPIEQSKMLKMAVEQEAMNASLTFKKVALEWYDAKTSANSEKTRQGIMGRLNNHVFPFIGDKPIKEVTFADLKAIVRRLESMHRSDMPLRVTQVLTRIFRYARINEYIDNNIAADISAIRDARARHIPRPAIIDTDGVAQLLRDIDAYRTRATPQVYAALKMVPYVALRSGELLGGRWSEINWDEGVWHIPAERMKMKRPHTVPLSKQVIDILKTLRKFSLGEYMFESFGRNRGNPISREALIRALRSMGYAKDEMCIHGFRSIFRSLGMENGYPEHLIEKQLSHINADSTIAAYDRAEYLEKRKTMMQQWADYLDSLRDAAPNTQADHVSQQ